MELDLTKLLVVAFACGAWATVTTLHLRTLNTRLGRLEEKFDELLLELAAIGVAVGTTPYGRDRIAAGLLGHRRPGI